MALWRHVAGYEGLYLVSSEGEVYALSRAVNNGRGVGVRKGKKLKPGTRGKGGICYKFVALTNKDGTKHHSIHRLVADAFLEKPDGFDVVNHKDRNTFNNCVENLEWCDQQYNNEYGHNKRISQYLGGVKIAEYKSATHASELTGIGRTSICNALNGWSSMAGGYEWKYCN